MTTSNQHPKHRIHPTILARARELRREMTPHERKLWACLRRKQLHGLKFRRQHPMFRFILDFYCHQHSLAVEIDGHSHGESDQQHYDQARTDWLNDHGVQVIRFTNNEIDSNMEGVLDEIAHVCGVPPSNSPLWGEDLTSAPRGAGEQTGGLDL